MGKSYLNLYIFLYKKLAYSFTQLWKTLNNLLAPGKCSYNLKSVIFKLKSRIDILDISPEIALKWKQCSTLAVSR